MSGTNEPPYTLPPDHLLLDLFNMPIVQPYAISEPFSTAGKINMNSQIVPFGYIVRNTGIQAVLKAVKVTAIPASAAGNYKELPTIGSIAPGETAAQDIHYDIDPDQTYQGFLQRFNNNDIFRSASEICSIYLVPSSSPSSENKAPGSPTYSTVASWWSNYPLTGKNLRESPYNMIYPRLTTKSNSYTVHFRVQSLRQVPGRSSWAQWNEGTDQVVGEYRGSRLIERYIDPSESLPDFANVQAYPLNGPSTNGTTSGILDNYYKFRIVQEKKF